MDNTIWHLWFAWFPVETLDKQLVWLQYVQRRWNNNLNYWGYDGHSGTDGGWEYTKRP